MVPIGTNARSCERTTLLFGSYARHLWKLDIITILLSFFINIVLGVLYGLRSFLYGRGSVVADAFAWLCLLPVVAILTSVANLLAYFKPRWFFYSRLPALHPMYTLALSLVMTLAWALQAIGYWNGPAAIANDPHDGFGVPGQSDFRIVITLSAVTLFCIWLTYYSLSVAAVAVLRNEKQLRPPQYQDTEAPLELADRLQAADEAPSAEATESEAATAARRRAPAFERVGVRPDVDLAYMEGARQ